MNQILLLLNLNLFALAFFLGDHTARVISYPYYQHLEEDLLNTDMAIPVYFAHETRRLKTLYEEITSAVNGDSATSALKGNPIYKFNFPFSYKFQ